MEDNLEKITINIDSKYADFINDEEFYVDILDDIKNVVYIKTLKTEIYVTSSYKYKSKYDGIDKEYFEDGDYIYVTLNNFNRINVLSKEIVPETKQDIPAVTTGTETGQRYNHDGNLYTKASWPPDDDAIVLFDPGKNDQFGKERDSNNLPINFRIKETRSNLLKYYDAVNITKKNLVGTLEDITSKPHYIYKHELSGTSCGPNDTNTLVINPLEPELKRFNINLWYINEDGKHEKLKLKNQNERYRTELGIFRVVMSFTIYFKRKKITRV